MIARSIIRDRPFSCGLLQQETADDSGGLLDPRVVRELIHVNDHGPVRGLQNVETEQDESELLTAASHQVVEGRSHWHRQRLCSSREKWREAAYRPNRLPSYVELEVEPPGINVGLCQDEVVSPRDQTQLLGSLNHLESPCVIGADGLQQKGEESCWHSAEIFGPMGEERRRDGQTFLHKRQGAADLVPDPQDRGPPVTDPGAESLGFLKESDGERVAAPRHDEVSGSKPI